VKQCVLRRESDEVRKFYPGLPGPVRVGIEATGTMLWFLKFTEELGAECLTGDPAKIRAYEPREQKNDRRDAQLLFRLLEHDWSIGFAAGYFKPSYQVPMFSMRPDDSWTELR
jgi:transposase